jgi:gliding motility-associated-like protein
MMTWQDSAKFHFLEEGNYYVVIEDTNGCRVDWGFVGVTVETTTNIDMSVQVTDIICNGDTNGTFRVLYPDSCYSYTLWRYTISPPYYLPIDTGTYFNGLIPGSYGVVAITNSGNCIDSALSPIGSALSPPLVINEPTSLIQNGISVKEVRCSNNGICDGEITLSSAPTGGIPPYYYSILDYGNNIPFGPIGSDSTFSGLFTDSFEVTLFDANACKVIDTVFVADSTLYIDSVITTNVSCFGFGNGTAIVYAHGGYKPYSYIWSNGDSTMIVDSLTNMQYSVILSDTQNCLAFDTINISQPGELFFNIKVVDGYKPESCKEVSYDGEFYMNYQGGTAPFNWSWIGTSGATGFGIGDTIFNLTFDTLTLFVTDANGCVGQPAWIHADLARVDALNALNPLVLDSVYADSILCYGLTTASIFIDVKSGEPTYTYSIDSGLTFTTDSNFVNLPAGNYDIEVRDTFGCAVYSNVSISQATEIIIFNDSIKHISCYDGTDGYLSISAEGGYAPYVYLWDPTGSTNNFSANLSVGMHSVSVTDITGCMKVDSISVVELTLPLTSMANILSHVSCFDSADGSATIQVQGGMQPYAIDWAGVNSNAMQAGIYIITINDSFNCGPIYDTVQILKPNQFLIHTSSITANPCFGDALGEVTLTANGGTMPYSQYFARDVILNILYSTSSPNIIGLTASDYDVWVHDANGCPSDTLKAVKIGEPGEIQISASSDSLTCFGSDDGVLELTLVGGTSPYEYVFSEGSNILTSGNINQTTLLIFNQLAANTYTLSVLDDNACPKTSVFILSEPAQIIADFTSDNTSGQETFSINLTNNSQGADVFYWDYDDGNQEILGISEIPTHSYNLQGQYEIMLVAENSLLSQNCNDTTFLTIDVQGFDVFNVFSPNDDGVNDIFDFDGWSLSSMYVEIYNRWGEKIYHWDSPNGSWNGKTYNDDDAPDGVYYFYLKANGEDGYLYQQQGSITLLR